jgi:hypothetical protein
MVPFAVGAAFALGAVYQELSETSRDEYRKGAVPVAPAALAVPKVDADGNEQRVVVARGTDR